MSHVAIAKIDLGKALAGYSNRWVALSSDEKHVVASAKHPREALKQALAKGVLDPILMWAPKEHSAYIV